MKNQFEKFKKTGKPLNYFLSEKFMLTESQIALLSLSGMAGYALIVILPMKYFIKKYGFRKVFGEVFNFAATPASLALAFIIMALALGKNGGEYGAIPAFCIFIVVTYYQFKYNKIKNDNKFVVLSLYQMIASFGFWCVAPFIAFLLPQQLSFSNVIIDTVCSNFSSKSSNVLQFIIYTCSSFCLIGNILKYIESHSIIFSVFVGYFETNIMAVLSFTAFLHILEGTRYVPIILIALGFILYFFIRKYRRKKITPKTLLLACYPYYLVIEIIFLGYCMYGAMKIFENIKQF